MTDEGTLMAVMAWARQAQDAFCGLTSAHINAPPGMPLDLAFKVLADCAGTGINAARAGRTYMEDLNDPRPITRPF